MKVHKNQSEAGGVQKPLTVLLVDDNPTFLATMSRTLSMLPHVKVLGQALDGKQALVMAQVLQPDLVLLDIVMPEFSGLEVAQIMRGWPTSPKVLFLSMHDNDSYRSLAKKLGALGLVGKANFVAELLPILVGLSSPIPESKS
jgi:DNA-binding NarL/FixJ family response regulator